MSDKLRYIGICGSQNSGKDFVGNFIARNVERECQIVKFATKLTEVVAAVLGVDDISLFQDRAWKEIKQFKHNRQLKSAREMQQLVGTDIMRGLVSDDIWVTAFANAYNDPSVLYITTDVRFPNELQYIQQNNGVIIYIDNRNAAQQQHRREAGITHSSEQLMWDMHYGVVQPDYVVDNNNYVDKQPLQDLLHFLSTI